MAHENNSVKITLIISGAMILLALLIFLSIKSTMPVTTNTVTIQGISSVNVMPDLVSVNFFIETRGNTSAEAKEANSKILNKAIDSLVAQGFDRADLKTENFNIYQDYVWEKDKRTENGFVAYHYLTLEVPAEDFEKLTAVVDAGVGAGAGINSIDFQLSPELQNQYKVQVLESASEDARVKAEAVAKGFDKSVGKLVSVQVNSYDYYPLNVYSKAGTATYDMDESLVVRQAVANIQPSEQDVSASVSATFQIK